MFYKVIYKRDMDQKSWDSKANRILSTSLFHSWNWLEYQEATGYETGESFICLTNDSFETPLAVCPVIYDRGKRSLSSPNPMGVPALAHDLVPSLRRKLLDVIFPMVDNPNLRLVRHPLNQSYCLRQPFSFENSFELLRYGLSYHVENTLVMDLSLDDGILGENVSKYHWRHIRKSKEKGIKVIPYQGDPEFLELIFVAFRQNHYASAGKTTRSQESWNFMEEAVRRGGATLFVAYYDFEFLSFLLCFEFHKMATGWSQVNVKGDEKEFSPRHLLEWEAMMYYKQRGFAFYEVGERYYRPQQYYKPTEKEISISEFKERYGGFLLPKITWYRN